MSKLQKVTKCLLTLAVPQLTVSLYVQMQTVTLIPGDGIGPEISSAVIKIFEAAKVRGGQR